MPIPSTITARRTRGYTSTWYIHPTTRKHDFEPMDGGGGKFFNRHSVDDQRKRPEQRQPNVSGQSAHMVHFTSAFYSRFSGKCVLKHTHDHRWSSVNRTWAESPGIARPVIPVLLRPGGTDCRLRQR